MASKVSSEAYQKTLARIDRVRSHLAAAPSTNKLKDRVCIITGVGSLKGIGRASALLYAREGAKHLYLLDFDAKNLPNLKETIQSSYPDVKVTTIQADAADEEAISKVCEQAIKEEGRLDVFFANAGIATATLFKDITAKQFMEIMRVNTLSTFLAIKHAAPAMKILHPQTGKTESEGSIILTASIAGIRSGAGPTDYSASKAAVINMAQTAAYQLTRTNIRVNSICPGLIETGMTSPTFDGARKRGTAGNIGQLNPLGRYGVAEEVAQAALFLACDDSSYVNAHTFVVDGGISGSHPVIPGKLA